MRRVCKCVFDEGPLGLSIYTTGEPPVRVRESWVSDNKDSNEEDLPGAKLFKTKAIQMNDVVETVNGENVLQKDYKYVLNLLREKSRPLTVTFTRHVYGVASEDIPCKEIDFTKKSSRKTLRPEKNEKKEEQEEVAKEEKVGEGSNQKETEEKQEEVEEEEKIEEQVGEGHKNIEDEEEEKLLDYGDMTVRPETLGKLIDSPSTSSKQKKSSQETPAPETKGTPKNRTKSASSSSKKKSKTSSVSSQKKKKTSDSSSQKKRKKIIDSSSQKKRKKIIDSSSSSSSSSPTPPSPKKKKMKTIHSPSPTVSSQKKREESPSLSSSNSSPIKVTLKSPKLRIVSKPIECPISKYSRLTLSNLIENLAQCYRTQHANVIGSFIATSGHIRAACNHLSLKTLKRECQHCSQYARNIPVWNSEDDRILLASEKDVTKEFAKQMAQKINEMAERRGGSSEIYSRMDFLESL